MPATIEPLLRNMSSVFLGSEAPVRRVICCLLARGHVLIEDVPGVGKTVLAHALARSIDCTFSRIQLTPDLLPADILGVSILERDEHGRQSFRFAKGPIFANIVLTDEVNRTPPRTQAALLEAMNEASVTVDGRIHRLEPPFMVVATQNPYDFEGTYMLPENQLDRFLMRINLGYPSPEQEARILAQRPADTTLQSLKPVMSVGDVISLQDRVSAVRVEHSLLDYIIAIAGATRKADDLQLGLSPRGALALAQAARATAVMAARDYVIPEDILENISAVCTHRIIPRSSALTAQELSATLTRIIETVPSPA